jgi:hypothetical protein
MTTNVQIKPGIEIPVVALHDGRSALEQLLQMEGYKLDLIKGRDLDRVAERLREFAPPTSKVNWQRKYLDNVLKGRQAASTALCDAINRLIAAKEGQPQLLTRARPVLVNVIGNVSPGAVVLGDGKPCKNPACPIEFVPIVPNQRFCSPACRRAAKRVYK